MTKTKKRTAADLSLDDAQKAKKRTAADLSLDDALGAASRLLKERQEAIEEREKALEKEIEAFRKEKADLGCGSEPSDVIHLNVGGTLMAVLRRTLTSVEGSMLASKFSGRWDDANEKDRDGNFFIDQPFKLFEPMVDYLRAKSCETPHAPHAKSPVFLMPNRRVDEDMEADFSRMLEYYGMTNGVYPMEVKLHCGKMGDSSIITNSIGFEVHSTEFSTFTLIPRGHDRRVKAFEVTLGKVEHAQIGWINPSHWGESPSRGQTQGVGDRAHTIGLDCSHFGFRLDGTFTSVAGVSAGEGSVIRCENQGSGWFVDGEPVKYSIKGDPAKFVPAISGKGTWQISSVELESR